MSLVDFWYILDAYKRHAVQSGYPSALLEQIKYECDYEFAQASQGRYQICPAYWICL